MGTFGEIRFTVCSSSVDLNFQRHQFPIKLAFAMTINK